MAPGPTLLRVATRFVTAWNVVHKAPGFGTMCKLGSKMAFHMALTVVSVDAAGNYKARWSHTME